MSSYVYMKVLESTPLRYDRGIRLLSGGAIDTVWDHVAELGAAPDSKVLDVGCGTGNLSLACAARGAAVTGVDRDAGMLDVARDKAEHFDGPGTIAFAELNALELEDRFDEASFDAAVSCLLFSELFADERSYVLETLRKIVRPGGLVVVADEGKPEAGAARTWWKLRRAPRVALTWLLTQTTTHALVGLDRLFEEAGYDDVESETMDGNFVVVRGTVSGGR